MYKNRRVTLKMIAQILSVSPATISKALRDSTDISDEMKRKVRSLTQELGYQPNLLARSLVQRRSNIIGVIIPDINISYYSDMVQYIYENAQKRGYESIVMFHHEDPAKERKNLQFLISLQVDGILISVTNGTSNRDMLQRIRDEGMPVICYDRNPGCPEFSNISNNDSVETQALIRALIEKGKSKIGYIGITEGEDVTVTRYNCYKAFLKKQNLDFDPSRVISCRPDASVAEERTSQMLQNGVNVDAFLCAGGFWAYGAGKAILKEGLKIPEDILLGEYGNNNIVQRLGISFFSVDHSPELIASEAVDLLDQYLKDKNRKWNPIQQFVPSKLIYHDHFHHDERLVKVLN